MSPRERTLALVVLPIFSALFLTLTVTSFMGMSPTYDEPVHLTTGYLILKSNDYRIDPEHPPFLRMWAALPLLFQHGIKLPDQSIDNAEPSEWIDNPLPNQIRYAYAFVCALNGVRRMLYPARIMIGLLGVFLGILIFFWAREWLGFWPAVLALGFYSFEPNILAHSSLVTTDLGVTCFLFGSVYFLCRTIRCLSMKNLSGLVAMSGLTAVSKFPLSR